MKILTVGGLKKHLDKYPEGLAISMYRPPFRTGYRIKSPETSADEWLYNGSRLYIPTEETRQIELPSSYKPKRKTLRRKDI